MSTMKLVSLTTCLRLAPDRKGDLQVLENLPCLSPEVAGADEVAVRVLRDLSGDQDEPSARDLRYVAVTRGFSRGPAD
jgi:hypothetical protein